MTQRAAFSPATCAADRRPDPPGHGLIKTIGSLGYRPGVRWTSRRFLRRDGGRRRVPRRHVRGHVTRGPRPRRSPRHRTADARRARGPGASRRPRGTARRTGAFTADRHEAPAPAKRHRGDRLVVDRHGLAVGKSGETGTKRPIWALFQPSVLLRAGRTACFGLRQCGSRCRPR